MLRDIAIILAVLLGAITFALAGSVTFQSGETLTAAKMNQLAAEKADQLRMTALSSSYRSYSSQGRFNGARHTNLSTAHNSTRTTGNALAVRFGDYSTHWNPATWDARYQTIARQTAYSTARQTEINSKATAGGVGTFSRISSTTTTNRGLNIGNSSQYAGDRNAGSIFHNISGFYACWKNYSCVKFASRP